MDLSVKVPISEKNEQRNKAQPLCLAALRGECRVAGWVGGASCLEEMETENRLQKEEKKR